MLITSNYLWDFSAQSDELNTSQLNGDDRLALRPGVDLPLGSLHYLLNGTLGGRQGKSRSFGEETKPFFLQGKKPRFFGREARSLVSVPTELPRI
jgi:hypothetical protein